MFLAHLVHSELPAVENVPAGHLVGLSEPGSHLFPSGQVVHDVDPVVDVYVHPEHLIQVVVPGFSAYVPGEHGLGSPVPPPHSVPTGHVSQ